MNKTLKAFLLPALFALFLYLFLVFLPLAFSGQIQINPILITIGILQIRWYGFLIAIGILLAYLFSSKELRKDGLKENMVDTLIFIVVLSGIIGARLGFVLQSAGYYFSSAHYLEMFKIWSGGLSIHGAIIAGTLALYLFCRINKLTVLKVANSLVPPIFLAGAIGRWGNFFNQEIIGKPADIPWKMFIAPPNRPTGFESFSFFHPVFLYESILLFCAFVFYLLSKKNLKKFAFAYTLIIYSLIRIIVEFWRIDYKPLFLGFDLAQLVSIGIALFGISVIFYQKRYCKTDH